MSLPTSRNRTYTSASPVRSSDLNDLQDWIININSGYRAQYELVLGPSTWQAKSGGGGVEGDLQWTFSALTELVCDLGRVVPVGHRIVSVQWSYNRAGAGNITRRVRKRGILTAGSQSNISAPAADNTGSAQETNTDTLNYTVVSGESVQLSISFDNAAHVFYGAVILVDKV